MKNNKSLKKITWENRILFLIGLVATIYLAYPQTVGLFLLKIFKMNWIVDFIYRTLFLFVAYILYTAWYYVKYKQLYNQYHLIPPVKIIKKSKLVYDFYNKNFRYTINEKQPPITIEFTQLKEDFNCYGIDTNFFILLDLEDTELTQIKEGNKVFLANKKNKYDVTKFGELYIKNKILSKLRREIKDTSIKGFKKKYKKFYANGKIV